MPYIQSATNAAGSVLAYPSNNGAGNLLVLAADNDGQGTGIASVSDTRGNTWARAVSQLWNFSFDWLELWYAPNSIAGANTVTVTWDLPTDLGLIIAEYGEIATSSPLDKTASAQSGDGVTSSPADSGNTATTTQAFELQIAAVDCLSATETAANGFTQRAILTNATSTVQLSLWDKTVSSTGAYKAQTTLNPAVQWAAAIATFKGVATLSFLGNIGQPRNADFPQIVSV